MNDGTCPTPGHRATQPTAETRRDPAPGCRACFAANPPRLLAAALGIAVAVALLASLGSFLAHSKATMTSRALRTVAVDWQVQVQPGGDPAAVRRPCRPRPGHRASAGRLRPHLRPVRDDRRQHPTTGPGVVLGLPDELRHHLPGAIRTLAGSGTGVLLAQQTACNLHAAPGDRVIIGRAGLPPVTVTVAGVVDLPQADSLFQTVGAPVGAQPTAPPDNVLLLPQACGTRSSPARRRPPGPDHHPDPRRPRPHACPHDPAAAYTAVTGAAHNLEAATAGAAVVGDNLGAALGAARQDAAYAQVLFLFLGLPGAVLAGLLTATVAAAGAHAAAGSRPCSASAAPPNASCCAWPASRPRSSASLGCVLGLAAAAVVGAAAFGSASFGTSTGAALALGRTGRRRRPADRRAAILVPARRDVRSATVTAGRAVVGSRRYPWWARYGLDVLALLGAGAVFTATSRNGYQLVLAPEGVPTISVSYWAFAGPALLWVGAGLLIWRLTDLLPGPRPPRRWRSCCARSRAGSRRPCRGEHVPATPARWSRASWSSPWR